jgi:hypothetical protein
MQPYRLPAGLHERYDGAREVLHDSVRLAGRRLVCSRRGRYLWIGMIYGAVTTSTTNVVVGVVWPGALSPWGLEASW